MGRPRKPGLEWLDPENADQHRWARDYLQQRGHESLVADHINPLIISLNDLLRAGQKLEEGKGARELFRDMKDAWRQEKSRNKKKEEGYRSCLFSLKGSTKDNLQQMANEQGTDATALLEKLIDKAYKAHLKKQQSAQEQEQPKQTIYGDRQDIGLLKDESAMTSKEAKPNSQKNENTGHQELFLGAPLPPPDINQNGKIRLQKKRTLTIRLGQEPTAKADDQAECYSLATKDEIEGPSRGSVEEPHPSNEIHALEQRVGIETASQEESPEIWTGTAPTEEDMRHALEKGAETAKHIRDKRTKLKP